MCKAPLTGLLGCPPVDDMVFCEDVKQRRFFQTWGVWIFAGAVVATLVGGLIYAAQGPADPTEAAQGTSHAVIVANSAIIVFREGLEAVLIFAAVTASLRGLRKPVAAGVAVAFAATVATWFLAQAILGQFSRYGDQLQAITGLLAIAVLLVVMNWFFHKVYWTKWIGRHNAQRKRVLAGGFVGGQVLGLVALGFTSVYREGFEVVLFLQNLQLQAGTGTVLEGVAIGLAGTAAVGLVTFFLQQKLPYKKMLVVTGVMLGVVLVVMTGGSARTLQDLGWLSTTPIGVRFPDWWARWFEVVPTWETVGAQALAAVVVVGSYFAAEHLKVRRPSRGGEQPAVRTAVPS
jgi:high-affinity iron transporter